MANLIALQNSYAANAHVMSVVQSMMNTLLQVQAKGGVDGDQQHWIWQHRSRTVGAQSQRPAHHAVAQLTTGKKAVTYAGMGRQRSFAIAARAQLSNISAFTAP